MRLISWSYPESLSRRPQFYQSEVLYVKHYISLYKLSHYNFLLRNPDSLGLLVTSLYFTRSNLLDRIDFFKVVIIMVTFV